MEQRISLVTLGVADLARARRFYEEGLGWRPDIAEAEVVFYGLGGAVLALWSRAELAADAGVTDTGAAFGGMVLAHNVRSREEVAAVLAEAERAGGAIRTAARDTPWGGHAGTFADPDGHLWEVAWNPAWPLGEDGRVQLP